MIIEIPETILFLIVIVSFVIVIFTLTYALWLRHASNRVLKRLRSIENQTDAINRNLDTTLEVVRDQQSN